MASIDVSARGQDGKWRGVVDVSDIGPLPGALLELDGGVVSPDGTEIRPLGTQIGAEPFHGQAFAITSVTPGASTTTVVLNASADRNADALLQTTTPVWFYGNPDIDPGLLLATRTSKATFTIPIVATGTSTLGYCLVQRVGKVHALQEVDGKPAVAIETSIYDVGCDQTYANVATTVIGSPLDFDDPPQPEGPSDGDEGCVLWPTPTLYSVNNADEQVGVGSTQADKDAARNGHSYDILGRIHTAAINGNMLLAVPGLGGMFQASIRKHFNTIDIRPPTVSWPDARWTRLLGIPRGILPKTAVVASAGGSLQASMYYGFAVGYLDPFTGEAGLPSPRQVGATTGTNKQFTVSVPYPRGVALEAIGLQIVLYATIASATEEDANSAALFPYFSFGPFTNSAEQTLVSTSRTKVTYNFTVDEDPNVEAQINPRRYPEIELPPGGASVVTVCKQRMVASGERPAFWDLPAWPQYEDVPTVGGGTPIYQKFYNLMVPSEWNVGQMVPWPAPLAMGKWPNSFGGRQVSEVGSYNSSGDLTMGTGNTDRTGIDLGSVNSLITNVGPQTHRVSFRAGTTGTTGANFDTDALIQYRFDTPSDLLTISEENAPAVCPATSKMPVDSMRMRARTTGLPTMADQLLVCTLKSTRMFSWAAMPTYPTSAMLNPTVGCASPHSSIEGPGFCAWLSQEGPVFFDGALQVLGHRIKTLWSTVLRDSEGMVVCSGSGIDLDRQIVAWALRTDTTGEWASATTDKDKQLVTSDLLLIFNYAIGAFSTIERPRSLGIGAIGTLPCSDGVRRIAWSEATSDGYYRILAATGFSERLATATSLSITADRDPSNDYIVCADADDYAVAGCTVFVRSQDGNAVRMYGRSIQVGAGSVQLSDGEGMTWRSGDVVVLGGPQIRAKTHLLRVQQADRTSSIVGVRVQVSTTADHCYAHVVVRDERGNAWSVTPRWGERVRNGGHLFSAQVSGTMVGAEVTLFADGYAALVDLSAEVEVEPAA